MAGALDWIGQGIGAVGNAVGQGIGAVGQGWSGVKRGLFPDAARNADLVRDIQLIQEAGGIQSETGRELLAKASEKYKGVSFTAGQFENPRDQVYNRYMESETKAAEARTQAAGTLDPVQKAKAVSELMGNRPWSGDEGDTYDERNPEHRIWMQSLQELGGGAAPETEPTPTPPTGTEGSEGKGFFRTVRDTLPGAARRPGSGLDSIATPGAQTEAPRPMTMAGALSQGIEPLATRSIPSPGPSPQQVENAGAVTVRNARKVQQSQAAPTSTLMAAARAVKAYKASPEYVEMTRQTGRLLNETDLSGPIKEALSGQSASDQKRLLQMIHKHGEAKVLAAVAQGSQGHGQ